MKSYFPLLFYAVVAFILFPSLVVFAWEECSMEYTGETTVWGTEKVPQGVPTPYLQGTVYSSTTDFAVYSISQDMRVFGTAGSEEVTAIIVNADTTTHVATSTTVLTASEIGTTYAEQTFYFDAVTLDADTDYYLLYAPLDFEWGTDTFWLEQGGASSTDFVKLQWNYTETTNLTGRSHTDIVFYCESEEEEETTGATISTSTIEWIIASSTEGMYTVGYALMLYLGIFIFLISAYLGFRFIRIFV
jgi:hypothetical protein